MWLPDNGIREECRLGLLATVWLVCNCAVHNEKSRNDALVSGGLHVKNWVERTWGKWGVGSGQGERANKRVGKGGGRAADKVETKAL